MKRSLWVGIAALSFLVGSSLLVFAEGAHKYVGVKKCSMCHKSEAKGNQYAHWLASAHAKAYETLATPEAQETAKKVGLSGNPQEAPECLKCHITGYGEDSGLFTEGFVKSDGVQCEACHGPGSDYAPMSVMKDPAQAKAAGLVTPTKEVCVKCHNKDNPNDKGFDYDTFYAKIAHPNPQKNK